MTKIFESVIALKYAVNCDERDQAVAEVFIHEWWNGTWHNAEMNTVHYNNLIVGAQLVRREKVEL